MAQRLQLRPWLPACGRAAALAVSLSAPVTLVPARPLPATCLPWATASLPVQEQSLRESVGWTDVAEEPGTAASDHAWGLWAGEKLEYMLLAAQFRTLSSARAALLHWLPDAPTTRERAAVQLWWRYNWLRRRLRLDPAQVRMRRVTAASLATWDAAAGVESAVPGSPLQRLRAWQEQRATRRLQRLLGSDDVDIAALTDLERSALWIHDLDGDELGELCTQLGWFVTALDSLAFQGGTTPCYADVTVYGALRSLDDTPLLRHLLAFTDIEAWLRRMHSAVPFAMPRPLP